MKKTIALIYRFVFIVFGVWGICQHIGFNILKLSVKMYDFTFVVDVMSLLCIVAVFVVSITHNSGKILQIFKNILTFCSIMILVSNYSLIGGVMSYKWILGVLLPLMMVIDWLLFDKKGNINIYDPLLWLIGALLLMGLMGVLFKLVFGVDNYIDIIGLFTNKDAFYELIAKALGLGFLIYIIDCISNALKKKSFKKTFALIYRLVFIALEIYAFVHLIGTQIQDLLLSIQYYLVLTNFLCTVCICVLIIYNLIKFKSIKRSQNPFPSLKGAFTVAILSSMMATLMLGRSFLSFNFSEMIFNYIAPIMMILDWIMFDYKGNVMIYDPLIWTIIPAGYYIYALVFPSVISVYPGIYNLYNPRLIMGVIVTVLVIGYTVYVTDNILKRR